MSDDFFIEPPARRAEPEPPDPWAGPPYGVLPGALALQLTVAHNDRAAVYLGRCSVYPSGFELELRVVTAPGAQSLDPSLSGIHARSDRHGTNFEDMLRFGVEFPDKRRATNLDPGSGKDSQGPLLTGLGGRGGAGSWRQDFWCWPLPTAGTLAFVCEWPAAGIPVSRCEVNAQQFLDASAAALKLFPNQPAIGRTGSWSQSRLL